MKTLLFVISSMFITSAALTAAINEELCKLLNARHAAALVSAKEGLIDQKDPFFNQSTGGMIFNPAKAISLQQGSFSQSLESATIDSWTFGQEAPWTPGKQIKWVILDRFGTPFLAVSLTSDQPKLIRVSQVTSFAHGKASLGQALQRYFYCEIESKDLVDFFVTTAKKRAKHKFVAASLTHEEGKEVEVVEPLD